MTYHHQPYVLPDGGSNRYKYMMIIIYSTVPLFADYSDDDYDYSDSDYDYSDSDYDYSIFYFFCL
jgi:hypothetical protein